MIGAKFSSKCIHYQKLLVYINFNPRRQGWSKHSPYSNDALASVWNLLTQNTHTHTFCPSPLPSDWRTLLTSRDIVILGRVHNWVNMSVLCVLSDMTPGCSCGGLGVLTKGFLLQFCYIWLIVHYGFACILLNPDKHVTPDPCTQTLSCDSVVI